MHVLLPSGKKFDFRLSDTFTGGSDLQGEVFFQNKWRHTNCLLMKGEILVSASIYELDAILKGSLIGYNQKVNTWIEMKNKKVITNDFTGDGFTNF